MTSVWVQFCSELMYIVQPVQNKHIRFGGITLLEKTFLTGLVFVLQGRVKCPQHNDPFPMSGPATSTGAGVQWRYGFCGQETHSERRERGCAARGTAGGYGPIR